MSEKEKESLFKEEDRQNFIWYTALGISKSDAFEKPDDEIEKYDATLKKCIERAYRDLNRTLKFTHSNDTLDKMKKNEEEKEEARLYEECKNSWRDGCEKLLREEIGELQKQIKQLDERQSIERDYFDGWHEKLCRKLVDRSQGVKTEAGVSLFKKDFTFGRAQKWVNMTLKYMLIMNVPDWEMNKLVSCLHVPIDSYILEGAYRKFPEELGKFIERKGNKNFEWRVRGKDQDGNEGSWVWSQIPTYDCYKGFQDAIREVLPEETPPIAWENSVWLEIAKERQKQKDDDSES